ncbi:protein of unknown function [Xenorhabdus doucetiae]|uniref:Uncharacterized protein n=1 Tax=Xenorhabdus doucetiae TaxID=351671 RepID=A0A068QMM9_9GAMM|nr:protein of unknown function [Xenorhabdus doucetiae]
MMNSDNAQKLSEYILTFYRARSYWNHHFFINAHLNVSGS